MSDYIFYTPIELAERIISLLNKTDCNRVVDISCGSWNLLRAVEKRLNCKEIVGIDIDKTVRKLKNDKEIFHCCDGRKFAIKKENQHKYDLVISNPPFGAIDENNRIIRTSLNETRLGTKEQLGLLIKRYEIEMLFANLLLLKDGGTLIIILPLTFFSGITYKKHREYIAKILHVKAIIELPNGTFKHDEISAVALVLEKKDCNSPTIKYYANFEKVWCINEERIIPNKDIKAGAWNGEKGNTIRKYSSFRGRIGSNYFNTEGPYFIIHSSSDYESGKWVPTMRKCSITDTDRRVHKGDIIICRVGKNAGAWAISNYEAYDVSDCIIVIPSPNEECIAFLTQNTKAGRLLVPNNGVATKFITQTDIEVLLQKGGLA